jgi:hypothetical protein
MEKRGSGLFLPFYREVNGRTYGVSDDTQLAGFQMTDSEGRLLNFSPTEASKCA